MTLFGQDSEARNLDILSHHMATTTDLHGCLPKERPSAPPGPR